MKKNEVVMAVGLCPGILGVSMLHAGGKMFVVAVVLLLISAALEYLCLAREARRERERKEHKKRCDRQAGHASRKVNKKIA